MADRNRDERARRGGDRGGSSPIEDPWSTPDLDSTRVVGAVPDPGRAPRRGVPADPVSTSPGGMAPDGLGPLAREPWSVSAGEWPPLDEATATVVGGPGASEPDEVPTIPPGAARVPDLDALKTVLGGPRQEEEHTAPGALRGPDSEVLKTVVPRGATPPRPIRPEPFPRGEAAAREPFPRAAAAAREAGSPWDVDAESMRTVAGPRPMPPLDALSTVVDGSPEATVPGGRPPARGAPPGPRSNPGGGGPRPPRPEAPPFRPPPGPSPGDPLATRVSGSMPMMEPPPAPRVSPPNPEVTTRGGMPPEGFSQRPRPAPEPEDTSPIPSRASQGSGPGPSASAPGPAAAQGAPTRSLPVAGRGGAPGAIPSGGGPAAQVPASDRGASTAPIPSAGRGASTAHIPPAGRGASTAHIPPAGRGASTAHIPPAGRAASTANIPPAAVAGSTDHIPLAGAGSTAPIPQAGQAGGEWGAAPSGGGAAPGGWVEESPWTPAGETPSWEDAPQAPRRVAQERMGRPIRQGRKQPRFGDKRLEKEDLPGSVGPAPKKGSHWHDVSHFDIPVALQLNPGLEGLPIPSDRFVPWLQEAWEGFLLRPGRLIFSFLLVAGVTTITAGILMGPMIVGYFIFLERLRDGEDPSAFDVFEGFELLVPAMRAGLVVVAVSLLLSMAGAAVGLALGVVPLLGGILALVARLAFAVATLAVMPVALLALGLRLHRDPGVSTLELFKAVARVVVMDPMGALIYGAATGILAASGSALMGIGVLVTGPLAMWVVSTAYDEVFESGAEPPA